MKISKLKVHWTLLRPFATVGILPPMLLGFSLAGFKDFINFIISFIGVAFILYGTHYHNSVSDYLKGVDTKDVENKAYTSASKILPLGLASVKEVSFFAVLFYLLGVIVFSLFRNFVCMIPCIIGLLCGVIYNEIGKYKGFGEILLALAFGLACTLAGYVPITGKIDIKPVLVSFIPGVLWSLFYTIDQYQDIENDAKRGIVNLAVVLAGYDFPISRYIEFGFFVVLSAHLYFILIHLIPSSTFIAVITSPLMFLSILTADKYPNRSALYLILTFGFYVLLIDLAIAWGMIF